MNDLLEKYGFKDELGHPLENCVEYLMLLGKLASAEGKLEEVREWQEDWDGVGTIDWPDLSAILEGKTTK